jgi:hypothetical protein
MAIRSFAVLALIAPLWCAAAGPACTLVAGGGRDFSADDSSLNNRWNQINFTFFDAGTEALRPHGPVEQAFFSVEGSDPVKNIDKLLVQAAKSGCNRLVLMSVFSDQAKPEPELVFAIRVSPIHRVGTKPGAAATLGTAEYEREYRFATTPAVLDKVAPGRIGDLAVRDFRAAVKR